MKFGSELYRKRDRGKLGGGGVSDTGEWVGTKQKEEQLSSETG